MHGNPLIAVSAGSLSLVEPTADEVKVHAAQLADWYSHPGNMRLMTATGPMDAAEVEEFYRDMHADGDRPFFIFEHGVFAGDADFRGIRGDLAEFAIMIGPGGHQGRGLGTRAASALHHCAFMHLGIRRVVLSVAKFNEGALRLYAKLGYARDDAPDALATADHPDDVTMALSRDRFYRKFPDIGAHVTIIER